MADNVVGYSPQSTKTGAAAPSGGGNGFTPYMNPSPGGTGVQDPNLGKQEPNGGGGWTPPRPSAEDLAAARYADSYKGSLYTTGSLTPAEPAEPVDTSYLLNDLLNAEAGSQAAKDMLKLAGYDLENPPKALDVPGMVDLPNRIDLPNVALPDEIALPDEVDYGEGLDFEKAMREADVNVGRVDNVNIDEERAMLDQLTEAQRQQAILQANNTVNNGITQLQRNQQNAQEQFTTQQNQIDIDEQRALDNQALYAEARGDRGGIGAEQYNAIQNTAATNRLAVQQEQTQLATDTARQIADLRAQGEFEKANQLLAISQNYLSQLMDLYTWAKEANIGIDEFNLQVAQWEENYKLSLVDAQLDVQNSNLNLAQAKVAQAQQRWQNQFTQEQTNYQNAWGQATDLFNAAYNQENSQFEARRNATNDYFNNQLNAANYGLNASKASLEAQLNAANATGTFLNGTPTFAAQQQAREVLAASGQALLEKGIIPTAEQLWAMGMTAEQASAYTGTPLGSGDLIRGQYPGGILRLPDGTRVGFGSSNQYYNGFTNAGGMRSLTLPEVQNNINNARPGGFVTNESGATQQIA